MIDYTLFENVFKDYRFETKPKSLAPTNTLFCGWRPNMEEMIAQFDEFANPGSHLTIMCATEGKHLHCKAFPIHISCREESYSKVIGYTQL